MRVDNRLRSTQIIGSIIINLSTLDRFRRTNIRNNQPIHIYRNRYNDKKLYNFYLFYIIYIDL